MTLGSSIAALALAVSMGPAQEAEPRVPRFLTDETVVWLGASQVLPIRVSEPLGHYSTAVCQVSDPEVLEVLRKPVILPGEQHGYLRVRGIRAGECELRMGASTLQVTVKPASERARMRDVRLGITTPVPRAVVWGKIAVGVDLWPGAGTDLDAHVRLNVGGDEWIEPVRVLSSGLGTWRRAVFELDGEGLPGGELALRAAAFDPDGVELEHSTPTRITIVHPDEAQILRGECEDTLDTPRPQTFGAAMPRLGSSPEASEARYVLNNYPDPTWILPLAIAETGTYQMMIVASGDLGAGALPSVGLCVSDPNDSRTAARLVDQTWHRMPLGAPVELEAGTEVVGVRFLNDNTLSPLHNRNLFLDRYELLRVDDPAKEAEGGMGMSMMSMSLVSMITYDEENEEKAFGEGGVSVAFERPWNGLAVNGRIVLHGSCRWDDPGRTPAPYVELLLNGERAGRQQAAKPIFALDRTAFAPGANELQLVARLADGRSARTPVQTVYLRGDNSEGVARDTYRFSVLGDGWDDGLALTDENEEPGHAVARVTPGTSARLELPAELEGDFDVMIHARGPGSPAYADVDFALVDSEGEQSIGQTRVNDWWNYRAVGQVTLARGPKTLRMSRSSEEDDADRFAPVVRSIVLRTQATSDRVPPQARIVYPSPAHVAHGVDAVVVEAWDDDKLEATDVLIDGRPQGTYGFVPEGAGHLVLPLLLRDVAPGEHALSVRVIDRYGNVGESSSLAFTVASEPPAERGQYDRAVHFLNRFAYGPDPRALAAVLVEGEGAWLERSLAERGPGHQAALDAAQVRMREANNYFVGRATVIEALRTDNPARARFVAWLENHFSTWIGKTQGASEWREHLRFAKLGPAPFGELLLASATSATMLYYLDQQQSFAGRLNENYAREIMELHTVGVDGGYSQGEVTELARLLTGLTLSQEALPNGQAGALMMQLRYDPRLGDGQARDILGMRFAEAAPEERFDRFVLALELLAAHPSTAAYVSRELAEHYVSAPAPDALVEDLALVFLETGGDMRALLLALAGHPAFWDEDVPARVATPFDYALRLARTTDVMELDWAVQGFLDRSGMSPYDRATPDGYPDDDAAWVDTNAMLQRWRLVGEVPWAVRSLVSQQVRQQPVGDLAAWRQRVVDLAAVRLTGQLLGEESNRAALDYELGDQPVWTRVDRTAAVVSLLPEASLK